MRKLREDVETARTIDIALVMRKLGSREEAWNYLRAARVAEGIIERVLSDGGARASMTAAAVAAPEAGVPAPAPRPGVYCATGRRRDVTSAALVQAALAILGQTDTRRAEQLLRREALPEEVIKRVLAGDGSTRRMG